MIEKTDIFSYFMKDHCPKCKEDSLVNLNFNDKITCVNPKCDFEWNRYKNG